MDLLVFNYDTDGIQVVFKTDQRDLAFFLIETNTDSKVLIAKWRKFEVYLGHYNCLYLQIEENSFLLYPKLPCHQWNFLSFEDGTVRINGLVNTINLQEKYEFRQITLGSRSFKGLIGTQKGKGPEQASFVYKGKFRPIRSLAELNLWQGSGFKSRFPVAKRSKKSLRQLLVCHDCGDNYKLDINPTSVPHSYKYLNFAHTDIFVYFSHHRVTVPPPAWTESAHRNGTLMLGTFITENQEGEIENSKVCGNVNLYAQGLAELMSYYGFDGYLINIEANCKNPEQMIEFLETLTLLCHSLKEDSLVIWYDSMDLQGEIKWKSQLNDQNLIFLQSCDGFFTDYHWKKHMPPLSAALAGDRKWQVFTGTDVFGRGTWGGGGFDTRIGVEDSACTSCAIFAPGWTLEKAGGTDFKAFLEAEKMLWFERANNLIDAEGEIYAERPRMSQMTVLQNWQVFVTGNRSLEANNNWEFVQNKEKYWEVTDDFEFVSSFVKSKREVKVDLIQRKIEPINCVSGSVELKGTGPKFNDFFIVELRVRTANGETIAKTEKGRANEQWQTVRLEIQAQGIVEVCWSECGFDEEYWQGFYGTRFRKTLVAYKMPGFGILSQFEERVWNEGICTWFNVGEGKKLWKNGLVLLDSVWNSLNDFDVMPGLDVLSKLAPDSDQVFHGTSSLKVPEGTFRLFRFDLDCREINIVIVCKGEVQVRVEGLAKTEEIIKEDWKISCFKYSGFLGDFEVSASCLSYLGGLHIFYDFPEFSLELLRYEVNWNLKSLDGSFWYDLQGEFKYLPYFIRHVDVMVNQQFVGRVYSQVFGVSEVQFTGEQEVLFIAEDLTGHEASCFSINLSQRDIEKSSPLELLA